MNAFLQIPEPRRLLAFQQVDAAMGLQAVSVEKDFWVCWTLRELFRLPGIGEHLTFKHADTFHLDLRADLARDARVRESQNAMPLGGSFAKRKKTPRHPPSNNSDWFRKGDDVSWQFGVPFELNSNN